MRKELKLLIPKEQNLYYKDNPQYFDELLVLVVTSKYGYMRKLQGTKKHLQEWMNSLLPLLKDIGYQLSTKCYWILNGLTDFPECAHPDCHKKLSLENLKVRSANVNAIGDGYINKCCSCKCSANMASKHEAEIKTKKEKYGEDYTRRAKARQIMLTQYGVTQYSNRDKCRETKFKNHGNEYWNNPEKISESNKNRTDEEKRISNNQRRKTCMDKFGYEYSMQNPEFVKKGNITRCDTCMDKYGVPHAMQSDNAKRHAMETNMENYGVPWYMMTDEFREKSVSSCNETYGVDFYQQSQEFKDKFKDDEFRNRFIERQIATKRENGTFNTSKSEEKAFVLLQKVFPDLVRQYRSDKYPFHCDFYSPSFDLYLEYNGTWTHGGHEFDPNDPADVAKLNKWKAKDTKYYINAVKTWSDLDKRKFETARRNNLNYIVFWNMNEVEKYVSEFLSKFV